ncbi:hypothetical protein QZH41_009438, partial [Actinostola sp. cb2023]
MKLFVATLFLLGVAVAMVHSSVPTCLPALASYLQSQETLLKNVQQELQATKQDLQQAKQSIAT